MKTRTVCRFLDVDPNLLRQWIKRGLIPKQGQGRGHHTRWSIREIGRIQRFIELVKDGYHHKAASRKVYNG